ncbi:redox-active disulfide protein 2 [Sphingobacterium sp. LRF_L2]|uniref:redox-active disulfide protein 2 n=1 Tax=Sphingobacterium sp. LRF_L2 TaxID=3369421 RepID=UPI003F6458C5
MEKNKTLNEMSIEELLKNKKSISLLTGLLTAVLVVLLGLTILTWITKGSSPLIAIPFALSPIVIMNYKKVSAINRELKSRNML